MKSYWEVNFDGLVGPTHNYAGLAKGNLRSLENQYRVSHPRTAALQGLAKMRLVHSLGVPQGLIPPQTRPDLDILRRLGYKGDDREVLIQAAQEDFRLFLSACSASSMWVANAATVTPSVDAADGKVHITPANLRTHVHRSYESQQTYEFLRTIFCGDCFTVHPPLTAEGQNDEGDANHMRLCARHGGPGLHVFVYGDFLGESATGDFPARQSLAASQAIASQHGIPETQVMYLQQNPAVISQGVFHNDVIAMSNEDVLICHQEAYTEQFAGLKELRDKYHAMTGHLLKCIEIDHNQLSVAEAVKTYFFNSQLITKRNNKMTLICPEESRSERSAKVIQDILRAENRIDEVQYAPLKESMLNGGGPACLRLRVVLNDYERQVVNPNYLLDENKFRHLDAWVRKNYREELTVEDLKSFQLFEESKKALEDLMQMINKGYPHE